MFYSMTGYGTGQATSKKIEVLCEIKSVNNSFVDISFRGYRLPNDVEEYIKNQIKKKFLRGSFEIKIHDNFQSEHSYELNQESIRNLKSTLKTSDFKLGPRSSRGVRSAPFFALIPNLKTKWGV